jgi:hypothetical protein
VAWNYHHPTFLFKISLLFHLFFFPVFMIFVFIYSYNLMVTTACICRPTSHITQRRGTAYAIRLYYTLRFYFPYLSLLAQPVNILVYWPVNILVYGPGPINTMYNVFFRILSELVFCLRYTITKTCRLTDLHVLSII